MHTYKPLTFTHSHFLSHSLSFFPLSTLSLSRYTGGGGYGDVNKREISIHEDEDPDKDVKEKKDNNNSKIIIVERGGGSVENYKHNQNTV